MVLPASGIGVGSSVDRIEFGVVDPDEAVFQELYVINTGDTAQHIQIIIEAVDIIVDPQSFDLDAGENKLVNVSLNTMGTGEYTGSILITASPLESNVNGLGFGAAVRVPVSFTIEDEMSEGLILVIMLLILFAVTALVLKRH